MKPLRIEIENILSYGTKQTLDLSGIDVACISGDNGAGKSSILDALTWITWGRARSNSADALIHQGADYMMGVYEFAMGDDHYRVTRRRNLGKSSMLTLDALSGEDWNNISGATIRDTQDKINDIIGADYDLFANSALLAQGEADQFTTKTPGQRKGILADILRLGVWNDYEDKAKAKVKDQKLNFSIISDRMDEMRAASGLVQELFVKKGLTDATEKADAISAKLSEAQSTSANAETAQAKYDAAKQRIHEIESQNNRSAIALKNSYFELKDTQEKVNTFEDDRTKHAAMQAELAQISDVDPDEIEQQTAVLQDTKNSIATLTGENAGLKRTVDPIKAQIERLKANPEGVASLQKKLGNITILTDPVCPTCGQALSEEHKATTIAGLETEIAEKQAENQHRIEELEQDVEAKREEYRRRQQEITALQTFLTPIEEELNRWKRQKDAWEAKAKEIDQLQHKLELTEQARLRIQDLEKRIDEARADQAEDKKKLQEQQNIISELQETIAQADTARQEVNRLTTERTEADRYVGAAQQKLATIESMRDKANKLTKERDEAAEQLGVYEELRLAFSKRGAPAMIIETAIPQIEQSANALLLAMTEGEISVRMETQSETKAGDMKEALDIIVSDPLGSRPYELYSGGESFRIDFAIRIALSKLLAHRAGTQIKSLFIDEGFGTQDKKGRVSLVSAINSIRDTFGTILAITHIDELLDAFPNTIYVRKHPDGSRIEVR